MTEEAAALEIALANLDAALRQAAMIRSNLVTTELNRDRLAAVEVLIATSDFIDAVAQWREDDFARLLKDLAAALIDLDKGHVASMLEPIRKGGRPISEREAIFKGQAASIMGGLMRDGKMSKSEAAAWVARRLAAAGFDVTRSKVEGWRKEALESPSQSITAGRYKVGMDRADWTEPVSCAEQLIRNLIRTSRSLAKK
jgi:hypothetical protein